MAASDCPDRLRNLIISTSYDQTVALDAPVFDPAATVKLVPYVEGVAQGLRLDGGEHGALLAFAEALGRVVRDFSRFEPLNQTPIHRSYPSPRSLYPVRLELVFARDGSEVRLVYEPEHHALCGDFDRLVVGEHEVRLEIVGDLERISPLYGNLGPTLCALEAGHILRQLEDALASEGHDVRCTLAGTPEHAGTEAQATSGASTFGVAAITLSDNIVSWRSEDRAQVTSLRVPLPDLNTADRQRVATARGHIVCPPSPAVELAPGAKPGLTATLRSGEANGRLRSSGQFPWGISGQPVDENEREVMITVCHEAYRDLGRAWPEHAIGAHLLMPRPGQGVDKVDLADRSVRRFPIAQWQKLADAFGSSFNIDLHTIPGFLVFSARFAELVSSRSSWPYMQMLCGAGSVAQTVCVYVTEAGFFARPFKGMIAKQVESSLAMEGQAFYSVILGKRASSQPYYSLSPEAGQ